MNDTAPVKNLTLVELGVLAAAVAAGVVLYFLAKTALLKLRRRTPEGGTSVSRMIAGPLGFLIVALALKLEIIRSAFKLGARFYDYVNAAVVFLAVLLGVRLIDGWLVRRYERKREPYPLPGVLHGFILIVFYIVVLFAVIRGGLGINITPFLATSAIFTAIIGLALQGVLSNVLAGISLNMTKSFSRGDWVRIGPHEGVILDTNWRETLVLDRFSNVVIIPNNAVASEMIINFARPDHKTALTLPLKVGAGAPPAVVLEALKQAAREVPDVIAAPAPQAVILSYDDLGISYMVKFWVTDFARKNVIIADVARHVWYKFKREHVGVPVSFGADVKGLVEAAAARREEAGGEKPEKERTYNDLIRSGFLRYQEGEKAGQLLVPEEEVRRLAETVVRRKYTRGEVLFRQGEKGESCFVVAAGALNGEIVYEEDGKRFTSEFRVEPGGIFGEMSLFTGFPRTATGVVEEEAELLEITAENFAGLLERNPHLAEVMAELVSSRNRKNAEFLGKIKELTAQDIEAGTSRHSILARLRRLVSIFRK
jgi:small-conductance mechanosensitive channel/CRP-like cAMP-binding protein